MLEKIERELLEQILKQNPAYGNILNNQLENLLVSSRKPTGVGCYVNFSNTSNVVDKSINTMLGFEGEIEVPNVPSGLCCVLSITDGRLDFLEFVTYGDETWNGQLNDARIVPTN